MGLRIAHSDSSQIRCGIVLSAGNGVRLRDYVSRLRGYHLPKQYVNFVGKRSMLEHTFHRAEKLIPAEQLYVIIDKEHLQLGDVRRQTATRSPATVVIQPENKGTAVGILLSLSYLHRRYPEAAVVFLPSDHFILEEDLFVRYVDLAFRAVEHDGSRLVLLGAEASEAAPDYGYIVPGEELKSFGAAGVKKIELFVEKPGLEAAKKLINIGALLNMFVIVSKVATLLDVFQRTTPELYHAFQPILHAIGTAVEDQVVKGVYNISSHLIFRHRSSNHFHSNIGKPC